MGIDFLLTGRTFEHKFLKLLPLFKQQDIVRLIIRLILWRWILAHFSSPFRQITLLSAADLHNGPHSGPNYHASGRKHYSRCRKQPMRAFVPTLMG